MTDIRTTREIEVGNYLVRVGKQEEQDHYDAAVIKTRNTNPISKAMASVGGGDGEWSRVDDAPIADHKKLYVAVGKAVEEYNEVLLQDD